MTILESLAMCWRSHAQISVEALKRIQDDPELTDELKAQAFRKGFEYACDVWKQTGLQSAIQLQKDNQRSRLDLAAIAAIGTEFGPGARKPHVSGWEQTKANVTAGVEKNGYEPRHEVKK